LTPTSRAQVADRPSRWWQLGRRNRSGVDELPPVTNSTILGKLKEQTDVTDERASNVATPMPRVELQAEPPEQTGLIGGPENWRPTVWFNPWMYQSGEQVWAGLAYEVISQITGRMPAFERERFWLKLNLRRVNGDAVRRRMHRALIERLIPLVGWLLVLAVAGLAAAVIQTYLPRGLELAARGLVAAGSGGLVAAGIARMLAFRAERASGALTALLHEPDYTGNWGKLLVEQTKNAQVEFLRDPGYEARLGFLYLVHTDIRRVLDLVATPQRPVVVLVDDLDRCSPGTVAQVIEAVNLFLAGQFPNCVFVLAMEPEMVAAHVQVAYRDLDEILQGSDWFGETAMLGWRFLDKFVQLPLSLPALDPARAQQFTSTVLVRGRETDEPEDQQPEEEHAQDLGDVVQQDAPSSEDGQEAPSHAKADADGGRASKLTPEARRAKRRELQHELRDDSPVIKAIVDQVAPVLDRNPREMKRFVNVFRFYAVIRQEREAVGLPAPESLAQVAKLAVLAVRWPQLRTVLTRQVGPGTGDTILALLEAPEGKPLPDASWAERRKALDVTLEHSQVPANLRGALLAQESLCMFLATDPPIGTAAAGFL
jgi:KAP family P-loop domain